MQDTPNTPGAGGPDPSVPPPPPPMPGSGPTPPPFPPYPPGGGGGGGTGRTKDIVSRVRDILVQPKQEWAVIEGEPSTVASLFTGYAMILAAIGPIAILIGYMLLGFPITYGIATAVITYVVSLATVFLTALIIDALAPTFGGTRSNVQATKLAVYCATPGWLVGIFNAIPQLFALTALLALAAMVYGIYLLYLGLPRLMRVTEDKAIGYILVVVVAWIVIYGILVMVLAGIILSAIGFGVAGTGLRGY
jgi:hypothetical protein